MSRDAPLQHRAQSIGRIQVAQYASPDPTSPPSRLPRSCQVAVSIVFLMNLTEPSAIRASTPLGCLLRDATFSDRWFQSGSERLLCGRPPRRSERFFFGGGGG